MSAAKQEIHRILLTKILKKTSRSFYLSMRVLPADCRRPISIAYLLARAADTIADTPLVKPDTRRACLQQFIENLTRDDATEPRPLILYQTSDNPDEQALLQELPKVFELYSACSNNDKTKICQVVTTLISGMIQDLDTFPDEQEQKIAVLSTAEELDHYTYLVAGCVGEFWTDVSIAHDPRCAHWKAPELYTQQITRGIRLGKALQLTNILRDVAKDLRIGRCYLPQHQLQDYQLTAEDLLNSNNSKQAQPILNHWLLIALEHYQAGIDYAICLPRFALRQRLAVFWPILIGLATLIKLTNNPNWLTPEHPVKVSRNWVYKMIVTSSLCVFSNSLMLHWLNSMQLAIRNSIHVD